MNTGGYNPYGYGGKQDGRQNQPQWPNPQNQSGQQGNQIGFPQLGAMGGGSSATAPLTSLAGNPTALAALQKLSQIEAMRNQLNPQQNPTMPTMQNPAMPQLNQIPHMSQLPQLNQMGQAPNTNGQAHQPAPNAQMQQPQLASLQLQQQQLLLAQLIQAQLAQNQMAQTQQNIPQQQLPGQPGQQPVRPGLPQATPAVPNANAPLNQLFQGLQQPPQQPQQNPQQMQQQNQLAQLLNPFLMQHLNPLAGQQQMNQFGMAQPQMNQPGAGGVQQQGPTSGFGGNMGPGNMKAPVRPGQVGQSPGMGGRGPGNQRNDRGRDRRGRSRSRSGSPPRRMLGKRRYSRERSYSSDEDSYDRNNKGSGRGGGARRPDDGPRQNTPNTNTPDRTNKMGGGQQQMNRPPVQQPIDPNNPPAPTRHLWIGDLPADARDDEIRQVFGRHGIITEIKLLAVNHGKRACFLAYTNKAAAGRCMNANNVLRGWQTLARPNSRYLQGGDSDSDIPDEPVQGRFPQNGNRGGKSFNLYMSNLYANLSRDDLGRIFGQYGNVVNVRKKRDAESAIVEYGSMDEAMAAKRNIRIAEVLGPNARMDMRVEDNNDNSGGQHQNRDFQGPQAKRWKGEHDYGRINRRDFNNQKAGGNVGANVQIRERGGPPNFPQNNNYNQNKFQIQNQNQNQNEEYDEFGRLRRQPGGPAGGGAGGQARFQNMGEPIIPPDHSASLYFPHVPANLDRRDLTRVVEPFGELESVRIIPSKMSPMSMAFVNFEQPESAKNCILGMWGKTFFGMREPIKVEFASGNPRRNNGDAGEAPALVIRGLDANKSGKQIKDEFNEVLQNQYPTGIKDVTLVNGGSLTEGYVAVSFFGRADIPGVKGFIEKLFGGRGLVVEVSSARTAIYEPPFLDGAIEPAEMEVVNAVRPLTIFELKDGEATANTAPPTYNFLHVAGLPAGVTVDGVLEVLKRSEIAATALLQHEVGEGENGACGYLLFKDTASAVNAKKLLDADPVNFDGPIGEVQLRTTYAHLTSNLVHVRTAGGDIPSDEISRALSRFGTIVFQKSLGSSDSVFIQFKTIDEAKAAVEVMHGSGVGGYESVLAVKYYDPTVEALLSGVVAKSKEGGEAEAIEEEVVAEGGQGSTDEWVKVEASEANPSAVDTDTVMDEASENVGSDTTGSLGQIDLQALQSLAAMRAEVQMAPMDTSTTTTPQDATSPTANGVVTPSSVEPTPAESDQMTDLAAPEPSAPVAAPAPVVAPEQSQPTAATPSTTSEVISPDKAVPQPTVPAEPPAIRARIAFKAKECAINIRSLAGNTSSLSRLTSLGVIKIAQRFKLSAATLHELERKFGTEGKEKWAVGIAKPDEGGVAVFNGIVDYFAGKEAAGMVEFEGFNLGLMPARGDVLEFVRRLGIEEGRVQEWAGSGKYFVAVVY